MRNVLKNNPGAGEMTQEHCLFFQRTQVQFPAPTGQLMSVTSVSRIPRFQRFRQTYISQNTSIGKIKIKRKKEFLWVSYLDAQEMKSSKRPSWQAASHLVWLHIL